MAVKFDLFAGYDVMNSTTGLYTNGADPAFNSIDMTSSVNLRSGNPLAVKITYNDTTLTMRITDTKTTATFTRSWAINIPATVGGNTAYVGFTASTGWHTARQQVLNWTIQTKGSPTPRKLRALNAHEASVSSPT